MNLWGWESGNHWIVNPSATSISPSALIIASIHSAHAGPLGGIGRTLLKAFSFSSLVRLDAPSASQQSASSPYELLSRASSSPYRSRRRL